MDVVKGISRFIQYWKNIAKKDGTWLVQQNVSSLIIYWEAIWKAVEQSRDERGEEPNALFNGFWPKTRQGDTIDGMFMDDGNIREEFD